MSNEMPMGGFMHGKVVDMFYFPIKYFTMPDWLGGDTWLFFSPIFNVADASITTGVLSILLFQRRFFRDGFIDEKAAATEAIAAEIDKQEADEAAVEPADNTETPADNTAESGAEKTPEA